MYRFISIFQLSSCSVVFLLDNVVSAALDDGCRGYYNQASLLLELFDGR
jgi:hypothetical protein